MRYWPPMIVPATKRARSSESELAPDLSECVEVLPLAAESPSGRGFEVSGRMRVFASEESAAFAESFAESSTVAPQEGHDRLFSAISDVQEIHLMRGEL
jgi:hypothetical protein